MIAEKDIQFASDLRNTIIRLIKKLRKESPAGANLSLTERSTMALLDRHGELLPSELAASEMITNQSMSQVLNHLNELGYIIRTVSETDKRKVKISLSETGKETLEEFRYQRDEWLANAIAATCTPGEQEQLQKAIKPLTKLLDYKPAPQFKY